MEVVTAIASIDDPTTFGPRVLEALASVIDFDAGSYNEVNPSAQSALFSVFPAEEGWVVPEEVRATFPRLVLQNPILHYQRETGDGSARRISDFITSEELHALELYQRIYRPLGINYQVAFGLVTKEPLVIAFALNRGARDFKDAELALLNALRPYLVQSYRNVHVMAALTSIDSELSSSGRAVVFLDDEGLPVSTSAMVTALLQTHFGPCGSSGLPDAVRTWVLEQHQRLLDSGRPRLYEPLVSVVEDRQLVARFIESRGRTPEAFVLEAHPRIRDARDLRGLGLTEREAELLYLLIRGASTLAIARSLDVSPGTVNKHLQHIYRKLGVSNRTAAVAAGSDALYSRQ